ncbi:ABC transporter substrate-binding protein [Paenibacillus sp. NPDC057967]|uniref:ABC transporter substrate-binding protein n=1 Tax=Paenibacillus sp. NPDC057967 TaxID=3346293 RepID=UPI0036D798FE
MKRMDHLIVKLGVILSLMVWIAGCTGTGQNQSVSAPAKTKPAVDITEPAEPATKVFTDPTGREVEVPTHPQRIVSLEFTGYLSALGIKPVGTAPRFFNPPFLELMDGVEDIGYPPSLEKSLELEPDLIIAANYLTAEQLEAFEKIAPVVLLKWSETNNMNRLTALADLLDRHEEERAWLESYQQLVQQTKDRLSDHIKPGETASVFYAWGTSINLLAPQVISTLFDDIGFQPTEKMKERLSQDKDFASETISREVVADYAADRIFIIAEQTFGTELVEEMQRSVLKTLPAFKEGKVYVLDPNWYSFEPVLLEWQLQNAIEVLTE